MALEIVDRSAAGYLGAQLFTGFMYIAAALCLGVVRVWKIGELERITTDAENSKVVIEGSSALDEGDRTAVQSSFMKRCFAWKKV